MFRYTYILLFLWISSASKLNLPRLLLPTFKSFSTNFTLEVSNDGCYRWSISRLDIVQLIPLNVNEELNCANKAVISTISKEFIRNTAIVLVEEVNSGEILRCDVIVDVISYLNIVTTTRQLYIEEAPEVFEVRAYDDQGNEFTTLEGVEFNWEISGVGQVDFSGSNNVLRFISFRDSPYKIPASIQNFDNQDIKGHIVLIEGVKTGSAKVSVKLKQLEYGNVPAAEVQLTVIANLIISPSDVYLLEGDMVEYKLLQVRTGKLVDLTMPSSQYYLKVDNENVAKEIAPWVFEATRIGRCKLQLHDRNIDAKDSNGISYLPSASVTVDNPAYLSLILLPFNNWAVMEYQPNTIAAEVFNVKSHKFHIGPFVNIKITIDEEYYHVSERAPNGSYVTGYPLKAGTVPVYANLESVTNSAKQRYSYSHISTQSEMIIYSVLTIHPSTIYIPWDSSILSNSSIKLKATGGDHVYQWSTDNSKVATVSQGGLLKVNNFGTCKVTVAMQKNRANRASASVYVLRASALEILDTVLEGEVNTPISLNVALYADVKKDNTGKISKVPFTSCVHIPFRLTFLDGVFSYNLVAVPFNKSLSNACATIQIVGSVVTVTKLLVSYDTEHEMLQSSAMISTFNPLRILEPASGETILAVGSQRHIVYSGGPANIWTSDGMEISYTNKKIINVKEVHQNDKLVNTPKQDGLFVYSVICNSIGQSIISIKITDNQKLNRNTDIKVICSKPRYVQLTAGFLVSSSSLDCPLTANSVKGAALNYEDTKIAVIVKDEDGRKFDNATSLNVKWSLSNPSIATVLHQGILLLEEKKYVWYTVPLEHYQIIIPKGVSGVSEIIASIVDYRTSWLKEMNIISEDPPFGILNAIGVLKKPTIEATFTLNLVDDVLVVPDKLSIFSHPKYRTVLEVVHGSGYYKLHGTSSDIIELLYSDASRSIEIIPKSPGHISVDVRDVCLNSKPASVEITVLTLSRIEVDMVDKIEKGHKVTATLKLYDSVDNPIFTNNPTELFDLTAVSDSGIVSIKLEESVGIKSSSKERPIMFEVTGHNLGIAKLTFAAKMANMSSVYSEPLMVHVYSPLKLSPANITIIPGAVFQISATGGPQPDCLIEYSTTGVDVIKIHGNGVVEGLTVGQVVVSGAAIGVNKHSGRRIIYSEANALVNVVELEDVIVKVPLKKIKVGSKMPIWVEGVPKLLTPLMIGTIQPSLIFKWSSSSPDVVHVRDIFHHVGIQVSDKDKVSMRIKALKVGFATVSVNVTVLSQRTTFTGSVNLEIFDELTVLEPHDPNNQIFRTLLLSPELTIPIKTNRDKDYKLTYKIMEYSKSDESRLNAGGNIASINPKGFLTTFKNYGKCLLIVNSEKAGYVESTEVAVEVKPVQYLMINMKSNLYLKNEVGASTLPRGMKIEFYISFHDNKGVEFANVRSDIKYHVSRTDQVSVSYNNDNNFEVNLLENGESVVKVWDVHSSLEPKDYVKLSVASHISPSQNEIIVGDIVCYSIPFVKETSSSGIWSTTDEDALLIDPKLGIAIAKMAQNNVILYYAERNVIITNTIMNVLNIQKIQFLSDKTYVSNNEEVQIFPLVILGETDSISKKRNNLYSAVDECYNSNYTINSFPFKCEIKYEEVISSPNINEIFYVKENFDFKTGLYSCVLNSALHSVSKASYVQSNIILQVLWNHYNSESTSLNFIPAANVYPKEINISCNNLEQEFNIEALPNILNQIQITSSDKGLQVKQIHSGKYLKCIVYLTEMLDSPAYLTVISSLTGQNIKIPVNINHYTDSGFRCSLQSSSDYSSLITPTLIIVVLLTIILSSIISCIILWPELRKYSNQYLKSDHHPTFHQPNVSHISQSTHSPMSSSFRSSPFRDIRPIYGTNKSPFHSK